MKKLKKKQKASRKKRCALQIALMLCLSSLNTATADAAGADAGMQEEQTAITEDIPERQPTENPYREETDGTENNFPENESSGNGTMEDSILWDGITMQDTWEAEDYIITFSLASHWQDGYIANITIENKGEDAIENWLLRFPVDGEILNIWSASVRQKEEKVYMLPC